MRIVRTLLSLTTAAVLVGALAAPSPAAAHPHRKAPRADACSADFMMNDRRFGPRKLPSRGTLGAELAGYRRFGDMTASRFLVTFFQEATHTWRYPPEDGFLTDVNGVPEREAGMLFPGQAIDRFGSEYGAFVAPAGTPYGARSISPQSLEGSPAAACNYHAYRVRKGFRAWTGPAVPWFGQPGLGVQYELIGALVPDAPTKIDVLWLVNNGYLSRGE